MKKIALLAFTVLSLSAFAQEEEKIIERVEGKKADKKQTQEIIIRKKGDKDTKVTVEINGDKVTINGKPLSEFKDDDITINKRNITIREGNNLFRFEPYDMEMYFNGPLKGTMGFNNSGAFLGVSTAVINDNNNDTKSNGAVIKDVTKGSAAEKAGLKEGDVITKINDTKIENPGDLTEVIGAKKPKDEVTVYYKREGKENSAKAILGERKGDLASTYSFSGPNGTRSFSVPKVKRMPVKPIKPNQNELDWITEDRLGNMDLQLRSLENLEGNFDNHFNLAFPHRQKIGLKIQDVEEGDGVKVLNVDKDSPAEKAGLKKDDVITEINGKVAKNTDEARELLKPEENKNNYSIKANRNGTSMSFEVKIPKKLKTANL